MGARKVREKRGKPKVSKLVKRKKVKEIRVVVRVSGTDLDGEKPLIQALKGIKGISHTISKTICKVSGFDPKTELGSLKEPEIKKIEEIIKTPSKFGIPSYLFNRRRDRETGKDLHLTGPDLEIAQKFDVKKLINLKTYRGVRHMFGLPVRGQRTRSSFRKGRVVGVVRKSARAAMKEKKK